MKRTASLEIKVTDLEERVRFLEGRLKNKQNSAPRKRWQGKIIVADLRKLGFKGRR